MPHANIWIRKDNQPLWDSIDDKSAWVNAQLSKQSKSRQTANSPPVESSTSGGRGDFPRKPTITLAAKTERPNIARPRPFHAYYLPATNSWAYYSPKRGEWVDYTPPAE